MQLGVVSLKSLVVCINNTIQIKKASVLGLLLQVPPSPVQSQRNAPTSGLVLRPMPAAFSESRTLAGWAAVKTADTVGDGYRRTLGDGLIASKLHMQLNVCCLLRC